MVRSVIRIPPWLACPANTENTFAPSAAIRSSTAFWAPLPSATIVITAPTPMMIPSIVSMERSMLARIDCKATATVSPTSMLRPRAPRGLGGLLLLPHSGNRAAASDPVDPLPAVLLRLDQARARKDENRVRRCHPIQHFAVIHVGQAGANPHRGTLAIPFDEDDVAGA